MFQCKCEQITRDLLQMVTPFRAKEKWIVMSTSTTLFGSGETEVALGPTGVEILGRLLGMVAEGGSKTAERPFGCCFGWPNMLQFFPLISW